ncbi:MAG TPA: hypothetical protein VNN09_03975 [Candidatus Competibacteraceae bacterium]|nr:hypothetical protein [Candidatus Competibacteraceae bacterium]
MLTLQECLDFCGLDEEEIRAIAEHEHVPEIVAAELGACLLKSEAGVCQIRQFMLEDIEQAESLGLFLKAHHLHQVLTRFEQRYPTARAG